MQRPWRVVFYIFSVVFHGFFVGGCAEYNRIPTVSEENTLTQIVQLTDGFDVAGEAFFSPDSRWIVFRAVATTGQPPRLYLAKLVSDSASFTAIGPPVCITPAGTRSAHGAFAPPDGLSIIFASDADAPTDTVKRPIAMRLFRADGWEGMVAMADRTTGVDLAQHPMETDRINSQQCSYSPDGKWICFSAGKKGGLNLFIMHADASHVVQLTNHNNNDCEASISPDGKSILFRSSNGAPDKSRIQLADLVFDRDGEITGISAAQSLTHDDCMNIDPAWHPDNRHIIYATSRHGRDNYELYLMDRWGRNKTRVTFSPGADLLPAFSPDGNSLMWTSKRSKDNTDEIFVARFHFPKGS